MKIDCVYYISLYPYTEEYKQKVLDRFTDLAIPGRYGYHLFPAVNGTAIPDDEQYSPMPNWKVPPEDLGESIFPDIKEFWSREITPGEIGCSLSHIKCWEDALQEGYENILILEGDFYCKEPVDWEKVFSIDWDVFHLGRIKQDWYLPDTPLENEEGLVRPSYSLNSHAYILKRNAIEKFLEANLRDNIIALDEFLTAMYSPHPREDVRNLFPAVLTAAAYNTNNYPVGQTDNKSLTEPSQEKELKKLVTGPTYMGEDTLVATEIVPSFEPDPEASVASYIKALREFEFDNGYKPLHRELFNYIYLDDAQKMQFKKDNFHPDFLMAAQDPAGYGREWGFIIEEPIKDVLCFPLFKKSFCDAIIEECEHFNHFLDEESGSNARDNYPTTDVRLESIPGTGSRDEAPLDLMYREWLSDYIQDIIKHQWRYTIKGIQETFVARYKTSDQPGLNLHHDLATCACLVRLNDAYKGGGTFFENQQTLVDPPVGHATIHPSRLTHRHGGRQVTEGTRYIIVTFID